MANAKTRKPMNHKLLAEKDQEIARLQALLEGKTEKPEASEPMAAAVNVTPQAQAQKSPRKKGGTATQILCVNASTGEPETSDISRAIQTARVRIDGVPTEIHNVQFCTVDDEGNGAAPVEALKLMIREFNKGVPKFGYAPSKERYYMEHSKFAQLVQAWSAEVEQKFVG